MLQFRKTSFLLSFIFITIGLSVLLEGITDLLHENALEKRASQTEGEIESIYKRDLYARGKMREELWMTVIYNVEAVQYNKSFKIPKNKIPKLENGQIIKVLYNPENPNYGRPDFISGAKVGKKIQSSVGFIMLFIGVQVLVALIWKPRPQLVN